MRRGAFFFLLLLAALPLRAQVDATDWHAGTIGITNGSRTHDGDNLAWASAGFDDTQWTAVEVVVVGPALLGWSWYRLHVKWPPDHPAVHLLAAGEQGTYELFVNGARVNGAACARNSAWNVRPSRCSSSARDRPIWNWRSAPTRPSHIPAGIFRCFSTSASASLAVLTTCAASRPGQRLYVFLPALGMDLLLILAGIGGFALFRTQPAHWDSGWASTCLCWGCRICC